MKTKLNTLEILKDFHKITGARISIHDLDFNEIAAFPQNLLPFCRQVQLVKNVQNLCQIADEKTFNYVKNTGKPYTYRCHCGLIETVAPIYNYGTLTGYFMMGQISDNQPHSLINIKKLSAKYFSNQAELENAFEKIPTLQTEMIDSYINILEIIAEYMTQTNRLAAKERDLAESLKNYIHKFYQKKLSVELLSETFGCSRTTLMNTFRKKYSKTIGNYITECRLNNAEKMLLNSTQSIKTVALDCGFSDQNYFVKVFRQKNNCTPTEYRKQMTL